MSFVKAYQKPLSQEQPSSTKITAVTEQITRNSSYNVNVLFILYVWHLPLNDFVNTVKNYLTSFKYEISICWLVYFVNVQCFYQKIIKTIYIFLNLKHMLFSSSSTEQVLKTWSTKTLFNTLLLLLNMQTFLNKLWNIYANFISC